MKRFIPVLLAGLMLLGSGPAAAQEGPNHDVRLDLTYTPLRVSSAKPSGVVSSNMGALTLSGEGRIYKGLMFGGTYSFGSSNDLSITGIAGNQTLTNVSFSDAKYSDWRLYAKSPFIWEAFADSDRTMGPAPAFSPVYGYVGYKSTQLSATAPSTAPTLGRLNIESASGVGFGLGADLKFDPVGLYGQFVYYPTMFTKSVGVSGTNANDGFLRVYEWDLGLRTYLGDSPVQAKVGYHFESHQAQNVQLRYDGFQFGASASF